MAKRAAQQCHPRYPDVMCRSRWEAQQSGELMYSYPARGWVLAKDRKPLGPPPFYRLTFCPYCGISLPNLAGAVRRVVQEWDGDRE